MTFRIAPLLKSHDRTAFSSGSAPLDSYFRTQVTQDMRRKVTSCFVAVAADGRIAGYYTLASSSIVLTSLPEATSRTLPRYPSVPVTRMGRLAVDGAFKRQGLGGALLWDGAARILAAEIASFALVVDAKDDEAAAFYLHHGFIALADAPLTLFLPMATFSQSR